MDEELKHFLSLLTSEDGRTYKFEDDTNGILHNITFVLYNSKGVDIFRTYDSKARNCMEICIQLGVPHK